MKILPTGIAALMATTEASPIVGADCVLRIGNYCMDSLSELGTFMDNIVELNLDGPHEQCCWGEVLPGSCECPEDRPAQDLNIDTTCLFDYCFTIDGLLGKIGEIGSKFGDFSLAQEVIGYALHFFYFVGSGGALDNAADTYLSIVGALTGVLAGLMFSVWLGAKVTETTITPYYMGETMSNHHEFKSDIGLLADLVGVFDAIWAIAYMVFAAVLVAAPLENAFFISQNASAENGFTHLYYGIVQAIGDFGAYWLLSSTASDDYDLVNAFRNWDPTDPDMDGATLVWDWIMLNVTLAGFFAVAAASAGGAYYYVYVNLVPQEE